MVHGPFSAHQGTICYVRLLQPLFTVCIEPHPSLQDVTESYTILVCNMANYEQYHIIYVIHEQNIHLN